MSGVGYGWSHNVAIILVLFILLVIITTAFVI
ncbi:sporulation protein YjcZ [Paenibacillus alginolyticus]|uniref:Sporulation protein YjcZ n=1 Tax=Paenibacillus alginolyticus TaxID=59839 RepID=A0ABT4GL24_9BACL|nr:MULTISPECIES: sporulation protein YjcZ [Paenibacillus]MCY9667282.1 sporulation protein YjcZ [Paenibacillus alginolyticus]MCY9696883.1 sporulation protein YjcZ [Paenibacillus alginolyticus]MEC0142027.1 sporulation protein YjcZ [Paenibacillus alginolyticus]